MTGIYDEDSPNFGEPPHNGHKLTQGPPSAVPATDVTGPSFDHVAAAADLDKDKFLRTLTNMSDKCNLFTETFYSKHPRYINAQNVLTKQ